MIYKIYNEEDNQSLIAYSLSEVKRLLDVADDDLEKLYFAGFLKLGVVEVIAYR